MAKQANELKAVCPLPDGCGGTCAPAGRRLEEGLMGNTMTNPTKAEAIYGWPMRAPVLVVMDDETLERMCRAHWPTWDRMRAEHQRKWRAKMKAAMLASWSYAKP